MSFSVHGACLFAFLFAVIAFPASVIPVTYRTPKATGTCSDTAQDDPDYKAQHDTRLTRDTGEHVDDEGTPTAKNQIRKSVLRHTSFAITPMMLKNSFMPFPF